MVTVSLHGIALHAPIGMYPGEKERGNDIEIDVDLHFPTSLTQLTFVDYSTIHTLATSLATVPTNTLEELIQSIRSALIKAYPHATSTKVCIRKLNPPLAGSVRYAEVCWEETTSNKS